MRQEGWGVGFPHSPAAIQITLSSVFSYTMFTVFMYCGMRLSFSHLMNSVLTKCLYIPVFQTLLESNRHFTLRTNF